MRRNINFDASNGLNGILFGPSSSWAAPTSFPNLSDTKILGVDIETNDPRLKELGPGFIRGDAKVAGISMSTFDRSWYLPIGHLGGGNLPSESVIRFANDVLSRPEITIVGANLQYELEGLDSIGIDLKGKLVDIQVAAALIDEECFQGYSLDAVAKRFIGESKDEALLIEAASAYGLKDTKGSLWKLPASFVGPYAEWDSMAPLKIFRKQWEIIEKENLQEIFTLESKILPILWKMRKQGVPVDIAKAEQLSREWKNREAELELELMRKTGFFVDVWSRIDLERVFKQLGFKFPTTEKGNSSFTGDFLEGFADPTIQLISEIREIQRMRKTFIDDWILKYNVRGRVHPNWRQLASDDGGTRTGRMACSNPNAQQIPAGKYRTSGKANPYGKSIRSLFISDTGNWAKFDYKQQEPRILTHFANLCGFVGAPLAAMAYSKNKEMDFYQYIVESAGIDRRVAKDMYLGLCYGMGISKLCTKLGKPRDEGERIINDFNTKVPFVKEIAESCELSAQQRGYIKTLLGRRRHFNKWEPADGYKRRTNDGEIVIPCSLEEAQTRWPKVRLVRADTRKALNSLIQGSAADMVKASLLKIYEETGDVPYLAVHDELDFAVRDENHAKELLEKIEHSVNMTVPVYSDMDLGRSWK